MKQSIFAVLAITVTLSLSACGGDPQMRIQNIEYQSLGEREIAEVVRFRFDEAQWIVTDLKNGNMTEYAQVYEGLAHEIGIYYDGNDGLALPFEYQLDLARKYTFELSTMNDPVASIKDDGGTSPVAP